MAKLETDKAIVDEIDEPGIPEIVRHKTQRLIQHAHRVVIEVWKRKGTPGKANGFKLTPGLDGYPTEAFEDIVETVMRCIDAAFRERKAEDPSLERCKFRVTFERKRNNQRERPSFEYEYDPEGPDMPLSAADLSAESENGIRDTLVQLVDKLAAHIHELNAQLISSAGQSKDMFEPLVQMMALANQNQVAGMEMQRRAMEFMYSTKRIEAEEAGRDRRAEKWMKFFEKPAKVAVAQIGKYMRAKAAGGRGGDEDEDEDEDASAAPAADQPTAQASASPDAGESGETDDGPDTKEHPLAAMANAIALQIRATHWAQAAQVLSKRQLALLAAAFDAQTDRELDDGLRALEKIPLPKLLEVVSILPQRVQDAISKLQEIVEHARKDWLKPEEPDA